MCSPDKRPSTFEGGAAVKQRAEARTAGPDGLTVDVPG